MIKLDLNKFKHVKSDDKSTTLEHKDGHLLTIAHSKLAPKMQEQLKALASTSKDKTEKPKAKMADGGEVSSQDSAPEIDPDLTAKRVIYNNIIQSGTNIPANEMPAPASEKIFGEAGEVPKQFSPDTWKQAETIFQRDKTIAEADKIAAANKQTEADKVKASAGIPVETPAQETVVAPAAQVPVVAPQVEQVPPAVSALTPMPQPAGLAPTQGFQVPQATGDMSSQLGTANQNIMTGINTQANALINKSAEEQQAADKTLLAQQKMQATFEQNSKALEDERQGLIHDINAGHIDPNKYWNDHSRVATGIGMIISGFGGVEGLKMAQDFLNKQQEQELQSQQRNLASKENLLSHNIQQYGNLKDGLMATRIMQNDILTTQLQHAASKANSGLAKAAALETAGKFQQENAKLMPMLAMSQTATQSAQNGKLNSADPAMFVRFMVPQEHQKQVFAEIQAAQNTKHMAKDIMQAFEQAAKENTVARTGAGMLRTPGSVLALHQHMQPTFQDLEGTVRQAAMDNTFNNITPTPGDSEHKVAQKRQALQEYLKAKSSAPTAKGFGIDLSQFQSTAPYQGADQDEGKIASNAKGERLIKRGGKWMPYNGK